MKNLHLRFYIDQEYGCPHIYKHRVTEEEVEDVLSRPDEDRNGREGSRVAIGRTSNGRVLRVIYIPDQNPGNMFVITAYELQGNPLAAYKRRKKKRILL